MDDKMKQAASDALSYFAVVANTEEDEGRREFSRKAGNWIAEAVEKLGGSKIVAKNMDAEERKGILETQYELAVESLHSQNILSGIIKGRDHRGGWNELKETLKGQMDDALKLAGDLDSLYSGENSLFLELAEREIFGDGGEEIDRQYVGMALNCITATYTGVLNTAYQAWGNEMARNGNVYDMIKPGFTKEAKEYANEMNKTGMAGSAFFLASADVLAGGKKVAKDEFMGKVEEYKNSMSAQISSAMKQMEDAIKNPKLLTGADYKGQEFA